MPVTIAKYWVLFYYEKNVEKLVEAYNHCYGCTAGVGSSCGGSVT